MGCLSTSDHIKFAGTSINCSSLLAQISGLVCFTDSGCNQGRVSDAIFSDFSKNVCEVCCGYFSANSINEGAVQKGVFTSGTINVGSLTCGVFFGNSVNSGVVDYACFFGTSENKGGVVCSGCFSDFSKNSSTIYGNAIFADCSFAFGSVQGSTQIQSTATSSSGLLSGCFSSSPTVYTHPTGLFPDGNYLNSTTKIAPPFYATKVYQIGGYWYKYDANGNGQLANGDFDDGSGTRYTFSLGRKGKVAATTFNVLYNIDLTPYYYPLDNSVWPTFNLSSGLYSDPLLQTPASYVGVFNAINVGPRNLGISIDYDAGRNPKAQFLTSSCSLGVGDRNVYFGASQNFESGIAVYQDASFENIWTGIFSGAIDVNSDGYLDDVTVTSGVITSIDYSTPYVEYTSTTGAVFYTSTGDLCDGRVAYRDRRLQEILSGLTYTQMNLDLTGSDSINDYVCANSSGAIEIAQGGREIRLRNVSTQQDFSVYVDPFVAAACDITDGTSIYSDPIGQSGYIDLAYSKVSGVDLYIKTVSNSSVIAYPFSGSALLTCAIPGRCLYTNNVCIAEDKNLSPYGCRSQFPSTELYCDAAFQVAANIWPPVEIDSFPNEAETSWIFTTTGNGIACVAIARPCSSFQDTTGRCYWAFCDAVDNNPCQQFQIHTNPYLITFANDSFPAVIATNEDFNLDGTSGDWLFTTSFNGCCYANKSLRFVISGNESFYISNSGFPYAFYTTADPATAVLRGNCGSSTNPIIDSVAMLSKSPLKDLFWLESGIPNNIPQYCSQVSWEYDNEYSHIYYYATHPCSPAPSSIRDKMFVYVSGNSFADTGKQIHLIKNDECIPLCILNTPQGYQVPYFPNGFAKIISGKLYCAFTNSSICRQSDGCYVDVYTNINEAYDCNGVVIYADSCLTNVCANETFVDYDGNFICTDAGGTGIKYYSDMVCFSTSIGVDACCFFYQGTYDGNVLPTGCTLYTDGSKRFAVGAISCWEINSTTHNADEDLDNDGFNDYFEIDAQGILSTVLYTPAYPNAITLNSVTYYYAGALTQTTSLYVGSDPNAAYADPASGTQDVDADGNDDDWTIGSNGSFTWSKTIAHPDSFVSGGTFYFTGPLANGVIIYDGDGTGANAVTDQNGTADIDSDGNDDDWSTDGSGQITFTMTIVYPNFIGTGSGNFYYDGVLTSGTTVVRDGQGSSAALISSSSGEDDFSGIAGGIEVWSVDQNGIISWVQKLTVYHSPDPNTASVPCTIYVEAETGLTIGNFIYTASDLTSLDFNGIGLSQLHPSITASGGIPAGLFTASSNTDAGGQGDFYYFDRNTGEILGTLTYFY